MTGITTTLVIYQRRWTWTGDFKCRAVKTGFCRNRSMQTGSSGTLIGWKSGQTTFVPLWDWMEGAWLRTRYSPNGTTYEIEICVQKSISNLLVVTSRSSRESLDCPLRTVLYIISQSVINKHASIQPWMFCIPASCPSYKSCVANVPGWPTGGHRTYNRSTETELLFGISASCSSCRSCAPPCPAIPSRRP